MDFDPLSLYTPSPTPEVQDNSVPNFPKKNQNEQILNNDITTNDDDDSHLQPLHTLDLPLLQLKPPYNVLITILKLLSPNEVLNFGNVQESTQITDPSSIFKEKEITELDEPTLSWFKSYCPRFDTLMKLAYIPSLSQSLRLNHTSEYNAYLTNLIINPMSWLSTDDQREEIHRLVSLRISENCGRTAQPEIIRKIKLNGLDKYSRDFLKLREPSLTNDNLGLKTWGSSLILSQRLLTHERNGYLYGNVLELGAGTGLVGMISGILGYKTYLTDLPEIVPNLKSNVELNELNSEVYELDWTDPGCFLEKYGADVKFQTIILSDPIYSSKHPYWVVNMINLFWDNGDANARVLIEIPLRPKFEAERELLWGLLEKNGYVATEHEIEDGYDDFGEMKFCFKMYIKK
ncbi:EFM2 Protein-lysine N-methyltransferase EFM2 [Candida maltosa Xu316]|uniref:S-adenosylmethionine-dependent methyltransferase n=1 Tax=Candida maltosa (strain Xu316) TaxID=1245528 RepID=M3HTA5_CANMX|nr:hypothetical protein G210_0405 [Candida maltosa Xu316]